MGFAQLLNLFTIVTQRRLVLVICSIFFLSASISEGAEPLRHLRISDSNSKQIAAELLDQGFDVLEGSITSDQFEVIASVEEQEVLHAAGYSPELLSIGRPFKDVQAEWRTDLSAPEGYLDYSETIAGMAATAENFPAICQLVDLTETYGTPATEEGRHLFALKISDNVSADEDEPAFLLVGNHHAREIGTSIIALRAIEEFTTLYGSDADITDIVNNNEIWIAPIWNPDGYDHVYYVDNLWRKNRMVMGSIAVGVDLNRNYPQGWYSESSGSSSSSGGFSGGGGSSGGGG